MPVNVKICGITTLEDARFAAAAGADMLGFVQYEASPRFVDTLHARDIIAWIHGPKSVGVFVNEALERVNRAVQTAAFDYVQLHGHESPGYCRLVMRPVIKAFRVRADSTPDSLRARLDRYREVVEYFLLDAYHPALKGGTGEVFRWDIAAALTAEYPILIAGGIGPHNVARAMAATRGWGIDCSSRLERRPGRKDFEKVRALFDAIHPPAG